jgi:hypothetical protein
LKLKRNLKINLDNLVVICDNGCMTMEQNSCLRNDVETTVFNFPFSSKIPLNQNTTRDNQFIGLENVEPMLIGWPEISNYLGYEIAIIRQTKTHTKKLVNLLLDGGYVFYKMLRPNMKAPNSRYACSFRSLLNMFVAKIKNEPMPEIPNNLIQTQTNIMRFLRIDHSTFKNIWLAKLQNDGLIFEFNGHLCAFEVQLKAALVRHYSVYKKQIRVKHYGS